MTGKEQILSLIESAGIIAVVRAESKQSAENIVKSLAVGGIKMIEITMTVPGAIPLIEYLVAKKSEDIIIGAGTVLDSETARTAILAGAEFVVSPGFNRATVETCNRYNILCTPGAMTVTEIINCLEAGASAVKLFPGSLLGPDFIKAVKGPLPQAKVIPTGGVSLDNLDQWLKAGALAVGVGGELTRGAKTGDYAAVTDQARQFVNKVRAARGC